MILIINKQIFWEVFLVAKHIWCIYSLFAGPIFAPLPRVFSGIFHCIFGGSEDDDQDTHDYLFVTTTVAGMQLHK